MDRLVFISESQLSASEASSQVADIISGSLVKNARLSLTGTLFFIGTHFAEILEGPSDLLNDLMKSIQADVRHRNIVTVERIPLAVRMFPDWSMAYVGPSTFVSKHVLAVLHSRTGSEQRRTTERLLELALELSVWRKTDEGQHT